MRQVLFEIPVVHVKIFGYGLMLFLAFWAGMSLSARQARKGKLDPERVYDLSLWMFLGGLLGARIFYVIQYWGVRIHSPLDFFKFWEGGIVLYGSGIGAAAALALAWWRRPFPFRPMLDAIAPGVALGIALGRIGCFLNGCCYGDVCGYPWAVSFPPGSPPWWDHVHEGLLAVAPATAEQIRTGTVPAGTPWSLRVHPTQLYSTIDGLALMLLLLAYFPLRKRDGEVLALLLVTYPVTRFLIEYLRNDEHAIFLGMTISQTISVGLFLAGLGFWVFLSRLPRERYADTAEPSAAEPSTMPVSV